MCAFISRDSFAPAAMSLVLRLIASRRQYKMTFFLSAANVDSKFRRSLRREGVEALCVGRYKGLDLGAEDGNNCTKPPPHRSWSYRACEEFTRDNADSLTRESTRASKHSQFLAGGIINLESAEVEPGPETNDSRDRRCATRENAISCEDRTTSQFPTYFYIHNNRFVS